MTNQTTMNRKEARMNRSWKTGLLATLLAALMLIGSAPAFAASEPTEGWNPIRWFFTARSNQSGTSSSGYQNVSSAYTSLNNFRREKGVWYWNDDNRTKTVFNTNSSNQLGTLKKNAKLEETAKVRAKEIATKFSHTRPNGQSCFTAYPQMSAYGENIAAGQTSVEQVMKSWKEENESYNNQGHRRNMLNPDFNAVGIACYKAADGTQYWVQCFGRV